MELEGTRLPLTFRCGGRCRHCDGCVNVRVRGMSRLCRVDSCSWCNEGVVFAARSRSRRRKKCGVAERLA